MVVKHCIASLLKEQPKHLTLLRLKSYLLVSKQWCPTTFRLNHTQSLQSAVAVEYNQGPLYSYIYKVKTQQIIPDPHQTRIVEKLQYLHEHLSNYQPPSFDFLEDIKRQVKERNDRIAAKQRAFQEARVKDGGNQEMPDFKSLEPEVEIFAPPPGFYMHGPVGCGKTLLLDLFFDNAQTEAKMRIHFNTFVLMLQSEMNKWRVKKNDEEITPIESIARNMLGNYWLFCFDEMQHSDFGTTVVLERLFSFLIAHGAVLVTTSNRPPSQLGASGFSQEQELSMSDGGISDFAQLLINTNQVHEIVSPTDYRLKATVGTNIFFLSSQDGKKDFEEYFRNIVGSCSLGPGHVSVYTRTITLPLVSTEAKIARFSFLQLCKDSPLGPADYLAICNSFQTIFVGDIPALSVRWKNEAKRLLTFIDAAYETKTKVVFLAETAPEHLFQLIPNEEVDSSQLEMLEEMAYDLKTDLKRGKMADLRSQGILTGEDEIFSFKRCISRIKEMSSAMYQALPHQPINFSPFVASKEEERIADARRKEREARRREDIKTVYPTYTKTPMLNLSTEWGPGSELYHESWQATVPGNPAEVEERGQVKGKGMVKAEEVNDNWWEDVLKRAKERQAKNI